MAYVLNVAGRWVCIFLIVVLTVLIWKTMEYFNQLPEKEKAKPVIAWDVLMLFLMLVFSVVRLVMT